MKQLYKWVDKEIKRWEGETRHFQENIAHFSRGVALSGSSHIRKIAAMTLGNADSQRRRLQRWLKRPCDMGGFVQNWTKSVMRHVNVSEVRLLVDETKIEDRYGIMLVGLAIEGRCIPLAWRSYIANDHEAYPIEGQVEMILTMLRHIQSGLSPLLKVTVMADRGISYSSNLVRGIEQLGWKYLLRVPKAGLLETPDGQRIRFHDMVSEPGEEFAASGRIFPTQGGIEAHVRVIWGEKANAQWALITNDDRVTGWEYSQRMWIELAFRDLKSFGWQLESSQLLCPQRLDRLLILLAVAYCWMLLWGIQAERSGTTMTTRRVSGGKRVRRFSLFQQGRSAFLKALHSS